MVNLWAFSLSTKFNYEATTPDGETFTVVYKTLSAKDLVAHDTLIAQWAEQNPNAKYPILTFYPQYFPQIIVKFIGFEIDGNPVDLAAIEDKEDWFHSLPGWVLTQFYSGFMEQIKPTTDTKKKSTDTSDG